MPQLQRQALVQQKALAAGPGCGRESPTDGRIQPASPVASGVFACPAPLHDAFEQILGRFEDEWQTGQRPDIGRFLLTEEALRLPALRELVHIE